MSAPAEIDTTPSSSSGDEEVRLAIEFAVGGSPEAEGPSEAFPDGLPEDGQGQDTRPVPAPRSSVPGPSSEGGSSSARRSSSHRAVKPPMCLMQTASPIPTSLTDISSISANGTRESLSTPVDQEEAATSTTWSTTPVTPPQVSDGSLGAIPKRPSRTSSGANTSTRFPQDTTLKGEGGQESGAIPLGNIPNIYPRLNGTPTGVSTADSADNPASIQENDPDVSNVATGLPDSSTPMMNRRSAADEEERDADKEERDADKVESWLKKAPRTSGSEEAEAVKGLVAKLKRFTKRSESSQASRKPSAPTEEVGRLFFRIANCRLGTRGLNLGDLVFKFCFTTAHVS